MEHHDLDRQMDELIEAVAAIEDYLYRHPFSGSLGDAMVAFADPDGVVVTDVGIDVDDEPTEREMQFAFTAIAIAPTLRELRVANPGEFARFVEAAVERGPGPAFDHAVAVIVRSHAEDFMAAVHNLEAERVDWSRVGGLFDLAAAATELGDEAIVAAVELHNLAAFTEGGLAREYIAAADAGLCTAAGPGAYRLSNTHRNADADALVGIWREAFDAIDACPRTEAGNVLHGYLLDRAGAHLAYALKDFGTLRTDPASGLAQRPALANELAQVYAAINIEYSARVARRGPLLPGGEPISFN